MNFGVKIKGFPTHLNISTHIFPKSLEDSQRKNKIGLFEKRRLEGVGGGEFSVVYYFIYPPTSSFKCLMCMRAAGEEGRP